MNKLTKSYKDRLRQLAGVSLIKENVTLIASNGRSDKGTLSWYAEEYLLNLGTELTTELDVAIKNEQGLLLSMSKGYTKMISNSLVIKLIVTGSQNQTNINDEFIITLSVNFESGGNTIATITFKGITDNLTLNSKHSGSDIITFKQNIITDFINTIKVKSKEK